ncbi:hypothetical protein CRG98_050149, partial [Punica granatum]
LTPIPDSSENTRPYPQTDRPQLEIPLSFSPGTTPSEDETLSWPSPSNASNLLALLPIPQLPLVPFLSDPLTPHSSTHSSSRNHTDSTPSFLPTHTTRPRLLSPHTGKPTCLLTPSARSLLVPDVLSSHNAPSFSPFLRTNASLSTDRSGQGPTTRDASPAISSSSQGSPRLRNHRAQSSGPPEPSSISLGFPLFYLGLFVLFQASTEKQLEPPELASSSPGRFFNTVGSVSIRPGARLDSSNILLDFRNYHFLLEAR